MASAAIPKINSAKIPNATQGIASNDTSVMLKWLSLWRFDFVASTAKVNSLLTNPSVRECSRRPEFARTKKCPTKRAGPVTFGLGIILFQVYRKFGGHSNVIVANRSQLGIPVPPRRVPPGPPPQSRPGATIANASHRPPWIAGSPVSRSAQVQLYAPAWQHLAARLRFLGRVSLSGSLKPPNYKRCTIRCAVISSGTWGPRSPVYVVDPGQ